MWTVYFIQIQKFRCSHLLNTSDDKIERETKPRIQMFVKCIRYFALNDADVTNTPIEPGRRTDLVAVIKYVKSNLNQETKVRRAINLHYW